jgi:hypothetical protein
VPQSREDAVYRAYGMTKHFNGRDGEVDHLVSLELGGTNATADVPRGGVTTAGQPREGSPREPPARPGVFGSARPAPRPAGDRHELGQGVQDLRVADLNAAASRARSPSPFRD